MEYILHRYFAGWYWADTVQAWKFLALGVWMLGPPLVKQIIRFYHLEQEWPISYIIWSQSINWWNKINVTQAHDYWWLWHGTYVTLNWVMRLPVTWKGKLYIFELYRSRQSNHHCLSRILERCHWWHWGSRNGYLGALLD